jgi:hypothetical protein
MLDGGKMAVAETVVPRFDMGRVIKRTFSVIAHNPTTFGILSLVVGVPMLVIELTYNPFAVGAGEDGPFNAAILRYSALFWLVYMLCSFVLQAAIVVGTISYLNGRTASLTECLSTGISFLPQLALMTVLVLVAFAAGLLLLVVPGIILMFMWFVAAPVCVVERTGAFRALSRSRALTRGYRWHLLGLSVLFFLLAFVLGIIAGTITGTTMFPSSTEAAIAAAANRSFAQLAASTIATMINAAIGATLVASVYFELRQIKGGIGADALASVFD